ncbi:MAG: DUF2288 domain-containing protein [Gammaproteobacteria bacterium]|nr:DUF2288 domain-containing protein [Gammaproteobacteria bacterium]
MSEQNPDILPELNKEEIRQKLNLETARINWKELEKHFARGVLITVSDKLDLIDVALEFVQDNKIDIEAWLADSLIIRTTDEQAKQWSASEPDLWAVVVVPWILIQQRLN